MTDEDDWQSAEARLRAILESAVDFAIVATDGDGRITDWNEGARRVLGWSAEDILGRRAHVIFTPEDRAAGIPEQEMGTALREGRAFDERWHQRRDGSRFWASGELMPLRGPGGAVRGFLKILRDRTEQHEKRETHNRGEARFLATINAGGDLGGRIGAHDWAGSSLGPPESWPLPLRTLVGVMLGSNQPMFVAWGSARALLYNDAYAPILGAKHPGAIGRPFFEVWSELREVIAPIMERAYAGESTHMDDIALTMRRHGYEEETHFAFSYTPVRDEAGEVAGTFCVCTETTGRVRVEAALRDSEARWRGLFERMGEAFFLAEAVRDASGRMNDFRFLEVNPAFERQTGLAVAETVGRRVRQAIPGVPDHLVETYARVVDTGEPANFEVFVPTLGERWYEARARREGPERFAVLFLDITARKAADAAAHAREAELRLVADALPVLIAFIDASKTYRFANRTYEQWFCMAPGTVVGRSVPDLVGDDGFERRRPFMERALAGEPVLFEAKWPYKDGKTRVVDTRYIPRRGAAGEVEGFYAFVIDITDRKRIEQGLSDANAALATSEDLLRRAQAAGRIGTFEIDLDRDEVRGSDEFWRVYGLPAAASMPTSDLEALVLPDDRASTSTRESREAGREARAVEYRIRRADTGQARWVARGADYVYDAAGRPSKLVGTIQDVTDRRQVADDLRRSEETLRAFMDAMPNQVWTSPPDGRLDWFNAEVYRFSGAGPGELDGTGWTGMVHGDDMGHAAVRWESALRDATAYETEFRLRRRDGAFRWHIARATPIRGPDGGVTRWIGTNTDIHEQKTLSAELADLNATLERHVDARTRERDRIWRASRDLIAVIGSDGLVKRVNPAWTKDLGHPESETVGARFDTFVHADDRSSLRASYERTAGGEAPSAFEVRMATRDGPYRWISWVVAAMDDDFYASGRDVTAQRQVEEQLRQSQKMEAVGQLTGGIAHDFNNLLTGISGALDLMGKRLKQGRTADIERYVGMALTSATRAAALTHRLLAFSRRQPLDPKATDANKLVAAMEELLRRTIGEGVNLEVVLAGGLWPTLCDPHQLENALLNLAINARDAMPDGGRLTIETTNAHLDRTYARNNDIAPGQYVCVAVTDTGSGMSPDIVARAFDPFFTTKPTGQGTGLGLSMIYGFLRQSDGHVRIYSEVGRGTTIKMYLPRFRGDTVPDAGLDDAREAHRAVPGETVLIVEDEQSVRDLVVEVLNDLGYRALEAGDGPAGLRILQSAERIDLLVTDVGLPGMNGRQLAEIGRQRRPDLKVLFITGYAENATFGNGHLDPTMQMMTKPFAVDAIAVRIREMIEAP